MSRSRLFQSESFLDKSLRAGSDKRHLSMCSLGARLGAALTVLLLTFVVCPGAASAQNVDWALSLNDNGFDPTPSGPVPAGGTVTYTMTVQNGGLDAASATTLDLDIPANTSLTGVSGMIGPCAPLPATGPTTVTCTVPPLAANETVSLAADVEVDQAGTITFGASVPETNGSETDFDPANNARTENTTIAAGADIGLTVDGPPGDTAASGDIVTYTFTAENFGPNNLNSAVLEFPIPTGLTNVTPPAGCSLSGGTYLCTIPGTVPVGGTASLDFTGQISAAAGSTVTPVGSVSGGSPRDSNTANNTTSTDTAVTAGSDVRMVKSRAPGGPLLVGDQVTFTLSPSYTGSNPTGLTITDTIPSQYQVDSVDPAPGSGWVCDTLAQDVNCVLTSGSGAGANVPLGDVTITATAISAGNPTNTASITADGPADPNPGNNSDTDGGATVSDPVVDLSASKSGPTPPLVVVGNTYDFNIWARNVGNAAFYGTVVMTDDLPTGLTYTGATLRGWTCTPPPVVGPAQIVCERTYTQGSPLELGSRTPHVTLQTEATASGTITNSMTVSSPDANIPDLNPGNDTATSTVTAGDPSVSADISLIKGRALATVAAGDVQTFTLEIVNSGPETSRDITVDDVLTKLINNTVGATDAGYIGETITANAATGVTCQNTPGGGFSRILECTIEELPVCTSGVDCPVITVSVRPGDNAETGRTNTADAISTTTPDPNFGNNADNAVFDVEARTDVTLTKVGSPDPVAAGQDLTYVLTATNIARGFSRADAVTITDTLPHNVTFISASPSAGSCSAAPAAGSVTGPGNDQLVCDLGAINPEAQQTLTVVVRPNTSTRSTQLTNTATVATSTTETDTGNNDATSTVDVSDPELDLVINKNSSTGLIAVGQDTVYTITVDNRGPSAAENVVVTDDMPATGISYQSHTVPADGACSTAPTVGDVGGQLVCSFPFIPAGEARSITLTARGTAKGTVLNNASVTSDEVAAGFDTDTGNNNADEPTTVRTRADLDITKTPPAGSVNLRDSFNFTIDVINRDNTGPLLAEADDVVVTDTLPTDMVLTATPTVAVISGTASASTCVGAPGAGTFSCDLGTLSSGGVVQITVPVKLTRVTAYPQDFTNQTWVETSSLDIDPSNNSDTATVTVNSSSVSGNVIRDFNNNGLMDTDDTGIAGAQVTLTGTSVDGESFTSTVTTDANGDFTFPFVPEGTYTISRGTVPEPHLSDGVASVAGATAGGTVQSATEIANVTVGANTDESGYLFGLVPQARIGIAKQVTSGPTINSDGSFDVTFQLNVENLSLERLENITITDPLGSFGTYTTAAGALSAGEYRTLSAPSGSCGGINGGFNGAGDQTVASGFGVNAGASCTVDISLQVRPNTPTDTFQNQATVTGEGALTGQTSAINPQLSDPSDDGSNPDPNGNGIANEPGENDPTPVAPAFSPSIELIKTGTAPADPALGDLITYEFQVRNTGDVTLSNVTISDPMLGANLTGGPITLQPGEVNNTEFTGSYALTQTDIDAGQVANTATTTGTDPFGTSVSDDGSTLTTIPRNPSISLTKTADASLLGSPTAIGDEVTFTLTVENTGNVTLTNVQIDDPLLGGVVSGVVTSLAPGATDTVNVVYQVQQSDLDAGSVDNTATASGDGPSGTTVTDTDSTSSPVAQNPEISLVKTGTVTNPALPGDDVTYTFRVENTGNVTLTDVQIDDPMLGGAVVPIAPVTLAPGDVDTTSFSATYPLTVADLDAGQVDNTATASGQPPAGGRVNAPSSETTNLTQDPSIALIKRADLSGLSTPPQAGEVITYRFEVQNTGNVTLTNVRIDDPLLGGDVTPTAPVTLAPGEVDTTSFAAPYTVTLADVDLGEVRNQATTTGTPPVGNDVTDLSGTDFTSDGETVVNFNQAPAISLTKTADTSALSTPPQVGDVITYTLVVENTGNVTLTNVEIDDPLLGGVLTGVVTSLEPGDSDTVQVQYNLELDKLDAGEVVNTATATGTDPSGNPNTDTDSTTTPLTRDPEIRLIKTADASALTDPAQVGQQITYGFIVENTGNVTLTNVTVDDPMFGGTLPGGPITLTPGQVDATTFAATHSLTQQDLDNGEVVNEALATGTPPSGGDVSDRSGADNATDGPTIVPVAQDPAIELIKEAQDAIYQTTMATVGDPLDYTFTVTNTGNVTLTNVTINDALAGVTVTGTIASLAPGAVDSMSITATYALTASDIAAGQVVNTATVTGEYSDASGTAQTVTDDSTDTAVVASVEALPEPFPPFTTNGGTTTSILASDTFRGDPATLANVAITVISEDPGVTLDPTTGLITLAPDQPAGDYEVTYRICSIDFPAICDETTETVTQLPRPSIDVVKTQDVTDNGDGITGVGDTVTYMITVENTGNVPVENLTLTDIFTAMDGTPLTLDAGPTFVSATDGSAEGDLDIGETATYTASFVLTIEAVSGGGLSNSVTAEGDPIDPPGIPDPSDPVSDDSHDGSGVDGPTELPVDPSLAATGLTIEKTAARRVVERGSTVPYTITVRNENPVVAGVLDIVDVLPSGFLYQPDSATLDGTPTTVEVAGRVIIWPDVPVPPLTTVTLMLTARVTTGADPGEHVNTASLRDPTTNGLLAPVATATVQIMPEPVFDCGDVIGTVFDDQNRDGYQNQGEIGIPSVRVVGVDGTIITTDDHGRFHVPCAMLPADRGSNFILKLDTRSLPSGYRLTTENPRVKRLTPGKMSEMNFGASITQVVRIDVNARAFRTDAEGRLALTRPLVDGIAKLLPTIAGEPVNLRFAYHLAKDATASDVSEARARMRVLERHVRAVWKDVGRVKLTIEQTIIRSGK